MKYALNKDFRLNATDYGVVLLNVESGAYLGLNDVGGDVLRYIQEGLTDTEIIERLSSEYDATSEQLRTDISQLMGDLISEGVIRVV